MTSDCVHSFGHSANTATREKSNKCRFSTKLRLIMMCHHEASTFFMVLLEINLSLYIYIYIYCTKYIRKYCIRVCFVLSNKVLLFFWLAKIVLKSRLGSKTWWPMASLHTTLTKGRVCSLSSAPCLWYKWGKEEDSQRDRQSRRHRTVWMYSVTLL